MDLQIKYENGQMTIHMNNFFPTSQAKLKKLLKVVDLDFEHCDDHIKTLQQFFEEKVKDLELFRTSAGKKHLEFRQKIADTSAMIESGKRPNGVKLTKDEIKSLKEDLKHYKRVSESYLSNFNSYEKQKEQFLKHLEILQERK